MYSVILALSFAGAADMPDARHRAAGGCAGTYAAASRSGCAGVQQVRYVPVVAVQAAGCAGATATGAGCAGGYGRGYVLPGRAARLDARHERQEGRQSARAVRRGGVAVVAVEPVAYSAPAAVVVPPVAVKP